jgi:hypothetical protein
MVHNKLFRCGLSLLQLVSATFVRHVCNPAEHLLGLHMLDTNYMHMGMCPYCDQIIFCNSSSVPLKLPYNFTRSHSTFCKRISYASEYENIITQWNKFLILFNIFKSLKELSTQISENYISLLGKQ